MLKKLDYASEEKKARLDNVSKLVNEIDSSATTIKILNFSEKFDLDPHDVKEKIKSDSMFALHFVKDPSKQSLHETLAASHIEQEIPLVQNFEQLSARGSDARYVQDGEIVSQLELDEDYKGKSLDFHWQYVNEDKTLDVYAMHKHTKVEGGSQDNQYTDLKLFLSEAKSCTNPNVLFVAIADGPYYQRSGGTSSNSRLEYLAEHFSGERSRVCDINTLPVVWHDALLGWHVHHNSPIATHDAEEFETLSKHVDDCLTQDL